MRAGAQAAAGIPRRAPAGCLRFERQRTAKSKRLGVGQASSGPTVGAELEGTSCSPIPPLRLIFARVVAAGRAGESATWVAGVTRLPSSFRAMDRRWRPEIQVAPGGVELEVVPWWPGARLRPRVLLHRGRAPGLDAVASGVSGLPEACAVPGGSVADNGVVASPSGNGLRGDRLPVDPIAGECV